MAALRQATRLDLSALAQMHAESFPGFFLTALGRPFLREYYRAVLSFPTGILLCGGDEMGIAGFAAGFLDPPGFYTHLRRCGPQFLLPLASALLRHPHLWRTILDAGGRVARDARAPIPAGNEVAELSSLAVAARCAGRGLGSELVEAFGAEATRRGAGRIFLATDAHDNDRVNRFYAHAGFRIVGQETTRSGRVKNHLMKDLVGPGAENQQSSPDSL